MVPGAALWFPVLAYLGGAAALRARAGAGGAACAAALERLLPAPVRGEEDLVKLCISVYPEAVCRAAHRELHQGDGGSAQRSLTANFSSGAACHAVDVALQGWRRSRAGPLSAATRLNAVSLDETLQRKAFEWEHTQVGSSAWIDQLVERVHKLHRTYAESQADLPAWVRDLSKYVTTSEAPKPMPVQGANSVAMVVGSMEMVISDLETFAGDPNMHQVVRGGIADVANVPAAYVKANMTIPVDSNHTRVDYAIEIPVLGSWEAATSTAISVAIAALMNRTLVVEEVSDFMSAAVESWLGPGIYSISVLNITRPTLDIKHN